MLRTIQIIFPLFRIFKNVCITSVGTTDWVNITCNLEVKFCQTQFNLVSLAAVTAGSGKKSDLRNEKKESHILIGI